MRGGELGLCRRPVLLLAPSLALPAHSTMSLNNLLTPTAIALSLLFLFHIAFPLLTYHVADEFFQTLEPVHQIFYGYSVKTWEWYIGLRSYASVWYYAAWYFILVKVLRLRHVDVVNHTGLFIKVSGAFVAVVSLCYGVDLWRDTSREGKKDEDAKTSKHTPLSSRIQTYMPWILSSLTGYWLYSCRRPITNALEMMFTSLALYYFHQRKNHPNNYFWYWFYAGIGCLSRPTNAVVHIFAAMYLISRRRIPAREKFSFVRLAIVLTVFWIGIMIGVDRLFYGRWLVSVLEFLKFNLLEGKANIYGVLPWHWYVSQGFPLLMLTYLIPFLYMNVQWVKRRRSGDATHAGDSSSRLGFDIAITWWTIVCFSFLPHKEFRFLLPIYPQALNVAMHGIREMFALRGTASIFRISTLKWVVLMIVPQLLFAYYFNVIHQRGSVQVMHVLNARREEIGDARMHSVLVLTPCHHTPAYFFLHSTDDAPPSVRLRLLDCSPPGTESDLTREVDYTNRTLPTGEYLDEADLFYAEPEAFVGRMFSRQDVDIPTHVVMYRSMAQRLHPFLTSKYGFEPLASVHNMYKSELWDSRMSSHIEIYERAG